MSITPVFVTAVRGRFGLNVNGLVWAAARDGRVWTPSGEVSVAEAAKRLMGVGSWRLLAAQPLTDTRHSALLGTWARVCVPWR